MSNSFPNQIFGVLNSGKDDSTKKEDNNMLIVDPSSSQAATVASVAQSHNNHAGNNNINAVMGRSFNSMAMTNEDSTVMSPSHRPTRESVLRRLSEALMRRSLTKIDLSQRGLISSDARLVKLALLQNKCLTVLKLGYNNLQDEGVLTLVPGITAHAALISLDLGFNDVGDVGCKALASALGCSSVPPAKSCKLQTLYLAGNIIGEDGALALADVIRQGCALRRLHLTGNKIGPDGVRAITEAITEDEVRRLNIQEEEKMNEDSNLTNGVSSQFFERNPNQEGMQELFLGGTSMGPNGCIAVSHMLERSRTIKVISVANCGIGDEELGTLSESIKRNREFLPLEALQISFNNITCKGLETLMNAVWGSRTLRELRLDNNNVGDRGAQQVAAILPSVTTLEVLDLGFNSIKSVGMRTLMKMVAETHNLQSLSIAGNTVDTVAAKAVAYGLAYNRSLKSIFLDHCSITNEGHLHIAAGVVSNSGISLRKLTGFRIGVPIVAIGLPAALEHWTNEQVLNFIHLMWEQSKQDQEASSEEKELDPLHFLPDPSDSSDNKAVSSGPLDASVVVEVAKRAYSSLGENGHDVFSRQTSYPIEPSFESPIAEDAIMVESSESEEKKSEQRNLQQSPADTLGQFTAFGASGDHSMGNQARSFVAPPAPAPAKSEPTLPDPQRKRRIVEWLCKHIRHLNELSQLPFNSGELWRLHQHYFTPVINESGGSVNVTSATSDEGGRIVCSVPDTRAYYPSTVTPPSTQSSQEQMSVPTSDPSLPASPPGASLPMLKRKVSYRFLGDAAITSHGRPETHHNFLHGSSVSRLIEDGGIGHSMPPKTKRARRNKTRISFLPRIKAKLDSYLDVCHEKALILMRQLHFVERALLAGEINPLGSSHLPRTHLSGVLAKEAEMILIDMM